MAKVVWAKVWIAAAALALAACAHRPSGPEAVVQSLYAPYLSHAAENGESQWDSAPVYTRAFKAEIERGIAYGNLLNEPVIDYDPVANAQEYSVSNLRLRSAANGAGARVVAHFDNLGEANEVEYDLVQENGAWKIDNIGSGTDNLRAAIETALKPAGDADEMQGPIRAIYETYAPPHNGAATPLYRWAPLSRAFAPLMAQAAAKKALPFDPVTDGADLEAATIKLEAAGAAVIVRLDQAGAGRVIVYDLVQDQGDWRVDDIRGPLAKPQPWDVRAILDEAGIR
jgi:hypothetical protein